MDTTTEIVVALIVAFGGVLGAYFNSRRAKQETANREVQFALLEKQANDNKIRIDSDLKLLHDFIHSHADEHKALDKKLDAYHENTKALVALTEQTKTLFTNQQRTENEVKSVNTKVDAIKDFLMKGGV